MIELASVVALPLPVCLAVRAIPTESAYTRMQPRRRDRKPQIHKSDHDEQNFNTLSSSEQNEIFPRNNSMVSTYPFNEATRYNRGFNISIYNQHSRNRIASYSLLYSNLACPWRNQGKAERIKECTTCIPKFAAMLTGDDSYRSTELRS